ncbi:MAG: cyclic nucleotide-binding domain-containing protein [Nitrospinaceae bacterium]
MEILKPIKIFQGLGGEDLNSIYKIARPKALDKGEYIFKENSPGDRIFLLSEGIVDIVVANPVNKSESIVLAKLKPHDVIGEFTLFDDAPRSASAIAQIPITYMEIKNSDLFDLFEKNNRIGMVVLKNLGTILCGRLRSTDLELRNSLLWIGMQSDKA